MQPASLGPHSPEEWKTFANSPALASIPLKSSINDNKPAVNAPCVFSSSPSRALCIPDGANKFTQGIFTRRDIFLDVLDILKPTTSQVDIFADVLACTKSEIVFKIPKSGVLQIYARVLTASSPVHLKFDQDAPSAAGSVVIYATSLDQPIIMSMPGSKNPMPLKLGKGSGHLGVEISFPNEITYYKSYTPLQTHPLEFCTMLETQLRMASVLFWRTEVVSAAICSHVANATEGEVSNNLINPQAVALGRQLAAQRLTGPDTLYFPVLDMKRYKESTQRAIDAASAFQTQFDRFVDRGASLNVQLQTWGAMLKQASDTAAIRDTARVLALTKYQSACDVVSRTRQQFQLDDLELDCKKLDFKIGIENWKIEQQIKAVIQILTAVLEFGGAIGSICMGSPSAGQAVEGAKKVVETVKKAEKLTGQIGKVLKSDTVQKLLKCAAAVKDLYPKIEAAVQQIQRLQGDPSSQIPGQAATASDAVSLEAIAAWDKWILESDNQMEFPVTEGIKGAAEYRLALRKHAINGKLMAQAQAAAIKAGQEFIHAQLESTLAQRNIKTLIELKEKFKGDKAQILVAQARFYDRLMGLRTSVAIEMRNLTWAYRYFALKPSSVELDPQKSIEGFKADLYRIESEINSAKEAIDGHGTFIADVPPKQLPLNYHSNLVESLKAPKNHRASFTLAPCTPNTPRGKSLAGPFINASHFRIQAVRKIILCGASPKVKNAEVRIKISTSGTYDDIQGERIMHFTSRPHSKIFVYRMKDNGEVDRILSKVQYDRENHAEPTPFTQWTLEITNPEDFDLSGLKDVILEWEYKAQADRYDGKGGVSQDSVSK